MNRVFKILIGLAVTVILVPLMAVVVITQLIDPNDYKDKIQQLAAQQTRGQLTLEGDLGWSFFPTLGFTTGALQFRLPDDVHAPFAKLTSATVGVQLLPLFHGEIAADTIAIDGLQLAVNVDAAGTGNWTRIMRQTASTAPANAGTQSAQASGAAIALAIDRVVLSNAAIHYRDHSTDSVWNVSDTNLSLSNVNLHGKPLAVALNTRVSSNTLGDTVFAISLNTQVSYDNNQHIVDFESLRLTLDNLTLEGDIKLQTGDTLKATGTLATQTSDAVALLHALGKPDIANQLGKGPLPVSLAADIGFDGNQSAIHLGKLSLKLANLNAQGDLLIHQSPLEIGGTLDIPVFNAQMLMQTLGLEVPAFQDPSVLRSVGLVTTFSGPPNSIVMNPLVLTLDDTTLKGQLGITDLDTRQMLIELKGNTLNADRYQTLPASVDNAKDSKKKPAAATEDVNATLLPLAALRAQRFSLKLGMDALIANKLHLEKVQLAARGADGMITLEHMNAALYGGSLSTKASIDARTDTPIIAAAPKLEGVQVGKLLTDLQGSTPFSGTASIDIDIKTRGNTMPLIKRNLNGPINITVRDGVLHGVSLERYTCQAIAATRKQQSAAQWPNDSAIERISMSLLFKDGVGVTQDLKGKLPQIRILGDGAVSLPKDQFDMHIGIALTGDLSGTDPACAVNENYRDIVWPVRCQGTFGGENAKTDCGLDSTRMNALLSKMATKEAKKSLEKKAEEKLGEDWNSIKGLFGK
ncbi:MAG TPA: AsmA family protein [Pseudomonadales bacterium]